MGILAEVDWDNDGAFASPSEDITDYVYPETGIAIVRGKDQVQQRSPAMAGTLGLVLKNYDQRFSPGNTASPVYGQTAPGKLIRISTEESSAGHLALVRGGLLRQVSGVPIDLQPTPARDIATCITDDLNYDPAFGVWRVGLPCFGTLSRLRGKSITTALYQNIRTDEAMQVVLDAIGWPSDARFLWQGTVTLDWWWADNQDAFDAIDQLRQTEGAASAVYENGSGWFIFENNIAQSTQVRSTVSQATYTDTTNVYDGNYNPNFKNVVIAVTATQVERQAQALAEVWNYGGADSSLILAPNEIKVLKVRGGEPFKNAVLPSPFGADEQQTLTPDKPLTSGSFVLEFRGQQSTAIAWNDSASTIQGAFEALSTVGGGNVLVLGSLSTSLTFVFRGTLKGQAVDLITVISTLNPGLQAVGVQVVDADGFQTNYTMYPTAIPTTGLWKAKTRFGNETGNLSPSQDALGLENAFNALPGISPGDVSVSGGPFPNDLNVSWTIPTDLSVITSTMTAPTEPTATLIVSRTVVGSGPDYIMVTGSATFEFNRDNGAAIDMTIRAGSLGANMTGLRVRAQSVTIVRTNEITYPDLSILPTVYPPGQIFSPNIRQEVPYSVALSIVVDLYNRYHLPRPTQDVTDIAALDDPAGVDRLIRRDVSDLVTLKNAHLMTNSNYFIEKVAIEILPDSNLMRATYGCEKATVDRIGGA